MAGGAVRALGGTPRDKRGKTGGVALWKERIFPRVITTKDKKGEELYVGQFAALSSGFSDFESVIAPDRPSFFGDRRLGQPKTARFDSQFAASWLRRSAGKLGGDNGANVVSGRTGTISHGRQLVNATDNKGPPRPAPFAPVFFFGEKGSGGDWATGRENLRGGRRAGQAAPRSSRGVS